MTDSERAAISVLLSMSPTDCPCSCERYATLRPLAADENGSRKGDLKQRVEDAREALLGGDEDVLAYLRGNAPQRPPLTNAEAMRLAVLALDAVIAQPWEPEAPEVLCDARDFLMRKQRFAGPA